MTVIHISGGETPTQSVLYFYADGRLELGVFEDEPGRSRLTLLESRRLTELLESRGFEEARAILEAHGPLWGCCDRENVFVEYRGRRLDFPCDEEVPKALQNLGTLVNDIAWSHFRLWSFISHNCLMGKEGRR